MGFLSVSSSPDRSKKGHAVKPADKTLPLQTRLRLGRPGDAYEQEADRMADSFVQRSDAAGDRKKDEEEQLQLKPDIGVISAIQRQTEEEEEPAQAKMIQRQTEEEEEPAQAKMIQRQTEEEEEPAQAKLIQRQTEEEEEPVQAKMIQRQTEEEEEPAQAKMIQRQTEEEEEPAQAKMIQRQTEEEEEEPVQAKAETAGSVSVGFQDQLSSSRGSGNSLLNSTKAEMESHFESDFSGVRIHTDSTAVRMNKEVGALAFTHGNDIYFNEGKYDPGSTSGKRLLAHEVTHVVQQGFAKPLRPSITHSGIQRYRSQNENGKSQKTRVPVVQRKPGILDRLSGRIRSGIRAVGRGAAAVAGAALNLGRNAILRIIQRVAPDFSRIFQRGGIRNFLSNLVSNAFQSLFGGVLTRIRRVAVFRNISSGFNRAIEWFSTISNQLASNDCSGITRAAHRISDFMGGIFGPVINRIRQVAGSIAGFFSGIWDAVGAPVMRFLRNIGGTLWASLTGFLESIGTVIGRVRSAVGGAWGRVKQWFGITAEEGTSEGGGLWNWIRDKATTVWNWAKEKLQPVMGPLRVVGTILVMISPAGPAIAIYRSWPYLRRAFQWIQNQWRDMNIIVRSKEYLVNSLLPVLMNTLDRLSEGLQSAADWLENILGGISSSLGGALESIGAHRILAALRSVVALVARQFSRLALLARIGIRKSVSTARRLFRWLIEFLKPLWEVLKKVIAIVVNPFGIIGLLLGTFWRMLSNCLKGPIINFIIDILHRFIRTIPPLPQLGLLWPFIKEGMLGFLSRMKEFAIERKVRVSNKIANIISGNSIAFAFGYLRGLVLGIWNAVIAPFLAIRDLFRLPELIRNFINALGENFNEILNAVREMVSSIRERAVGTYESLVEGARDLIENPRKILDIIRSAISAAMEAVHGIGRSLAERMMSLFESSDEELGQRLGRLTGSVLVNVILAVFTAGGSAATSAISGVARILGAVARNLLRVIRAVMNYLPRILRFVRRIGGMFSRARSGAGVLLSRVGQFFQRIMRWLSNAFRRLTRRGRRATGRRRGSRRRRRDSARWGQFIRALRSAVSPYRENGITKSRLRSIFRNVRARFSRVVRSSLRPIRKHNAFWTLWARRRRRLLARPVGRVLMDRNTRWRAGKKAIKRQLRRIPRRSLTTSIVESAIRPLQVRYRYRSLRVVTNGAHVWNVVGSMSPGSTIATTNNLPTGRSSTDAIPIIWYKPEERYPQNILLRPKVRRGTRFEWVNPPANRTVSKNAPTRVPVPPTQQQMGRHLAGRRYVTVGVPGRFWPSINKTMRRTLSSTRRGGIENAYKTLLKNYRFSWKIPRWRSPDHVQDLGWGGPDRTYNLWPLGGITNLRANRVYTQRVQYSRYGKAKWGRPMTMIGKWFRITRIQR